jgi:hypothetical protein
LGNDFVLWCDNSNFYGIRFSFDWDCFLHVVVRVLLTVEADYLMVRHWVLFLIYCWDCLYKTNHCFITLWVKFAIVPCFDTLKLVCTIFDWILWSFLLDRVFKIIGQDHEFKF